VGVRLVARDLVHVNKIKEESAAPFKSHTHDVESEREREGGGGLAHDTAHVLKRSLYSGCIY